MFKKILFIIYILIFIAIAYYVVTFFYDRETENTDSPIDRAKLRIEKISNDKEDDEKNDVKSQDKNDSPAENPQDENIVTTPSQPAAYTITREQCYNNCEDIDDQNKKNYCQEFCGIASTQNEEQQCDDLSELKKDYCIRDNAVEERDFKKCSEIVDSGIRKQCQNRIREEIIDEIM